MSMLSFNECNERSTFVKGFFRKDPKATRKDFSFLNTQQPLLAVSRTLQKLHLLYLDYY